MGNDDSTEVAEVLCRNCGFENPLGTRFCGNCSALLNSDTSLAEERKHVTILFADAVASTRLSGTVDAEQLREQMARFFDVVREEIERQAGTVEKFIGDAVMAVFGLPKIREDDPERAVRAALSILARTRPYVEAGVIPEIRIGVNTGEVVADPRAITRGEFLVTGEAVNLAVRLQQHAQPGQVLVGESTYAATQWAFDYYKMTPLQIKGKQEKVVAYACLRQKAKPLGTRAVPRRIESPLVGRHEPFATLTECIERLHTGQGGIVAIIGEPGIGKSRLVAEARRLGAQKGLHWLEGRSLSFTQGIGYWPLLEIIRTAAGITERDDEATSWVKLERRISALFPEGVEEIVPYLGTLLGLEIPEVWRDRVQYLDGEAMGRQIYRSSRLFLEHLAQERPVVLVFEDLQWADHSSVALLDHLFPLVNSVPLLLCGLGRPDPSTPAARLREIASREYANRYTEILLTPLSPPQRAELVHNLLGTDHLPVGLQEAILQKSAGNPFFVEELIRGLIDTRAIFRDEATGSWKMTIPTKEITISDTLRGVIIARVDQLDEESKQVLKTAAVIGRHFHYRLLRALTEQTAQLDRALAELLRLELIREHQVAPELEYIFKHDLIQEATYETILMRQRRDLHRRVGQAIEAMFGGRLEEFYGMLARHYALAEEWEKARDYLFKAGDQAGRLAADAEALAYYQEAMGAYSRVQGDGWKPLERATLERKMGEALFRRGEHRLATEYFQRALTYLGSPFPTSPGGVRVATVKELLRQIGHLAFPGLLLRQARGGPEPGAEEQTRIYEAMGWIDYFVDVDRLFLEALTLLNLSERNSSAFGIARGSMGLGLICDFIPVFGLARIYHRRAVTIAEKIQHPLALGLAYVGLAFHEFHARGECTRALEHFQRSAAAYRQAGELRQWGAVASEIPRLLRFRGDIAHSLELSREVLRVGQETGDPEVRGWGLAELGRTLLQAGALDDAAAHLKEAAALFDSIPDHLWVVFATSELGACLLRQGKLNEAIGLLEGSTRLSRERGFRGYHRTLPLTRLADGYLVMAEHADKAQRRRWLRKAELACRVLLKQGKVDVTALLGAYRFRGTCEWLKGKPAVAHRWWQRSLTASERLEGRYEAGMTLLEIGKRLGERTYLARAEEIFSEIGARWDLAQARECETRAS